MSTRRLAVIDLGSNTFHLLICAISEDGTREVLYKERVYVKLASGGLDWISPVSVQRGMEAMTRFAEQIRNYDIDHVRCIGTAALREARNGSVFAAEIESATGLQIDIIDGHQEAGYILKGIRSCIPPLDRHGLIMDIGGGSVEFILFQGDTIFFTGSYKIGVGVLFQNFHHSDPIGEDEILELEMMLDHELGDLLDAVKALPGYDLIGASGSFEVIQDVLPKITAAPNWSWLNIEGLEDYLEEVIHTDMKSRRNIPEIPIERVDYIVVAYVLIRYVLRHIPPQRLLYCDYALKEGVLYEMNEKLNF